MEEASFQEETQTNSHLSPAKPRGIIIAEIIVVAVLFFGLGFYLFNRSSSTTPTPPTVNQNTTPPLVPTKPRSTAPGIITGAVFAKNIDPKTGAPLSPTSTFSATDKDIYIVATTQNPKVGTKIEYVRYLNNKYLDNRSVKILKPATTYVSFVWSLKNAGSAHPAGVYRVKLYTNGIFEQELSYTVQSGF